LPRFCQQEDLRQLVVNPAPLNRVSDRNTPDILSALREGQLDAAQLFEPFVEEALASNIGHLWYAADSRGRTTYTAFITTRQRLKTDCFEWSERYSNRSAGSIWNHRRR